jgi:hypothetical protein
MTHFRNSRPYPFGSSGAADISWHKDGSNTPSHDESYLDMNILS